MKYEYESVCRMAHFRDLIIVLVDRRDAIVCMILMLQPVKVVVTSSHQT